MPELGRAALFVCLALTVYATVAGFAAARERRRRLAVSAQNALYIAFGMTVVAAIVLAVALIRSDFTFVYVADHTSSQLPWYFKLTAFWGGQEGSLLLWLMIVVGFSALAVFLQRRAHDLVAWVVPVMGIISTFFTFLLVGVASPFAAQAAAPEGFGLNPSLQNPYMIAHPPTLYLGYVGVAIPFAFAMGALLSGRTDDRWIVITRRWTLVAWAFLGIGQLLGSHWAYQEVGWGGYFAWDPVENAALMPWLAATAFLHSVMVQEKKGMLKVWNMLLIALTFNLSIFGTFITRSGVLNSVHSFTQSSIGAWFLGFICLSVAGSLFLIWRRLPLLRSKSRLESLVSREATFLYNNLLLVALCLTIFWGVIFPMLSEAVRGTTVTVGEPYFNFFLRIFGLPLLLLMGIGPLIAWRRASLRSLGKTFAVPTAIAAVAGVALAAAGGGETASGMIAYTFSAFVMGSILLEFWRGTRARRSIGGVGWLRALAQLVSRNRRRYGGYVVHASMVMLAVGIAGSAAFGSEAEGRLAPGQSLTAGGYTMTYRTTTREPKGNHVALRAQVDILRDGKRIDTMQPGKNQYLAEQQVSNEMAIRTDPLRAEDLNLILDQSNPDGSIYLKVVVKPLVNLIWASGIVFVLGSLIALWPDAREQRRLLERYQSARNLARS